MKTLFSLFLFTLLSTSLMAQTPVALKLNLEKGKIYRIKTEAKQTMQQAVAGQSMVVNITANVVTSFKMLGQVNDVLELEMKFDTVATKMSAPMYSKETNSTQPGKDPVDRIMNKMSLFPLIVKVSNSGKFISFVNYDAYKGQVMMVIDSLPDSKKDEARKQADVLLKESALKSKVEPLFIHLPDKKVNINDAWETSYIMNSNDMSFLVFNAYTLKAVEHGQALLSGTSEMESMPSTNPAMKMDQPLKGNSTFEGRVDLACGMMSTISENNHIEGTLTVNNNGTDLKVDLKIDAQSETQLIQ